MKLSKSAEKIAKKLHGTEVIALFGGLGMGKTGLYKRTGKSPRC